MSGGGNGVRHVVVCDLKGSVHLLEIGFISFKPEGRSQNCTQNHLDGSMDQDFGP